MITTKDVSQAIKYLKSQNNDKALKNLWQHNKISNMIGIVLQENEKFKNALNKIASWGEGKEITSSFDSPHCAKIAREALK